MVDIQIDFKAIVNNTHTYLRYLIIDLLFTEKRIKFFIMGDDDEVMRFEITDQDLEDEMTSSYGKKRMSKNKQIYGVWADNSDSEEDARPSFGGKDVG